MTLPSLGCGEPHECVFLVIEYVHQFGYNFALMPFLNLCKLGSL